MQQQRFVFAAPTATRSVAEPVPAHNGTRTTQAAAQSIRPQAGALRALVLDFISSCGDHGATRTEIEEALGMSGNTVRPRVRELEERALVCSNGETRPTPSGRAASVLIAVGNTR